MHQIVHTDPAAAAQDELLAAIIERVDGEVVIVPDSIDSADAFYDFVMGSRSAA